MINDSTPIWQLTVAELKSLIRECIHEIPEPVPVENTNTNEHIYGIAGLAEHLNCSKTTAQKLKSSGAIDPAITQIGRQIIINKQILFKVLSNNK